MISNLIIVLYVFGVILTEIVRRKRTFEESIEKKFGDKIDNLTKVSNIFYSTFCLLSPIIICILLMLNIRRLIRKFIL